MPSSYINRRSFVKQGLSIGVLSGLALTSSGLLSACTPKSANKGSAAQSKNTQGAFNGELIVGFDQEFPPYGYIGDDGEFTGFDLDLAQEVCKRKQWTYTPSPISWDAKDALLNSGQISCIWNGFTVEGRENDYTFTDPYMENRQVVVVSADSDIKKLSDLADKNVITQTDSAALNLLQEGGAQSELGASFAKLDTIDNYNTAFMSLEQGTYDAVAIDYPVAVFNIDGRTDEFTILDEALNSEHFAVGFAKDDAGEALAAQIQETLQEMDADGFVKKLCKKYADQGITYDLWCLPKK